MGNLFVLYLVWPAKIKGKVGFCGFSLTPKAVKGVPNALMSSFHVAEEVSYRSSSTTTALRFSFLSSAAATFTLFLTGKLIELGGHLTKE